MVISNLDLSRASISPLKYNPPLTIDADAVLPCQIMRQRLELISWWNLQIHQPGGVMNHVELSPSYGTHIRPTGFASFSCLEKNPGAFVSKRLNCHKTYSTLMRYTLSRYM